MKCVAADNEKHATEPSVINRQRVQTLGGRKLQFSNTQLQISTDEL